MMAESTPAVAPTLADQVSKLYELVAGYHATNLLEIARELGAWEALTQSPGLTSEALAARLGTHSFYTALPYRIRLRAARPGGCRVAHGAALRPDLGRPRVELLPRPWHLLISTQTPKARILAALCNQG